MKHNSPLTWTVSGVARQTGVTVRTLHHYDKIGLLQPRRRSDAGYRLYAPRDLQRLHQILLWRELGVSLEAIGALLDQPDYDVETVLRDQRAQLVEKHERLAHMIAGVDEALAAHRKERTMTPSKVFKALGEFDPSEFDDEVQQRWGTTDTYAVSAKRTKHYKDADWTAIRAEAAEVYTRAARLMDAGHAPTSPEAGAVAETHRLHIERWFYPCSHAMHAQLAEMYTADPRFAETFESVAVGLAQWFADAVRANARGSQDQ